MSVKNKIASGLGSVLEWYDFALYGFFAPLIAQLYFPSEAAGTGLIKTFSVFAIGFIARPFGALIFGSISDRYGRIVTLKITPILITIPTFLFVLLPTYQQIGVIAPILLVLLRIFQGIFIGGEYASNIVYLCESAHKNRTYFMGSLGSCSGSLGIFLASSIAGLWNKIFVAENLLSWGWRAAFALSLIIGVATYFLRKNMSETAIFEELTGKDTVTDRPIFESFKNQWKDYLIACGLTFLPATAFYFVFMFLPNLLNDILQINASKILGDNSISLLSRLFIIPIIGLLADQFGGIKIIRLSSILFMLLSYPLLLGVFHNPPHAAILLFIMGMLTTLNAATIPGLLVSLLKPNTRCTILSLTFNFCFGVFGGLVPAICLCLVKKFGDNIAPAYYLIFAAFITFVTTYFFKKGKNCA